MKICKNCGAEIQDGAAFCTHCGTKVEEQRVEEQRVEPEKTEQAAQPVEPEQTSGRSQAESQNAGAQNVNYGQNPNYGQSQNYGQQGGYQPNYTPYDPYDHTSEFTAKDISDNKVIAMLVYLMGTIGIIVALLASKDARSAYRNYNTASDLDIYCTDRSRYLWNRIVCVQDHCVLLYLQRQCKRTICGKKL